MPQPGRAPAWAGALDDGSGGPPRFRMRGWASLWLPVIVSFVVQVPAAVFSGRFRGFGWGSGSGSAVGFAAEIADDPARFVARLALALVGPVALVFARRFPGPVVAVVTAAAGAYVLVVSGDTAPPYIALAFAVIGAVVRGARRWAWISLGAGWLATVILGIALGVRWQAALVVAVSLALVLCVAAGSSIRLRRQRYDEYRRRAAERRDAVAQAERVRIARELHDVLAHSLSQISVQAGVGLHLIDSQPDEAARALASIKATSRTALDEVRSVLGVLRDGGGVSGGGGGGGGVISYGVGDSDVAAPLVPEPDLSRLPGLVESLASQGVTVTLSDGVDGASTPRSVQLAVYRIVQESLTNVVRHSGANAASVSLRADADGYHVLVRDAGAGGSRAGSAAWQPGRFADVPAGGGSGRGLLGMRERAELLGGRLTAGPTPDGGFAVEALLPAPGGDPTGGTTPAPGSANSASSATPPSGGVAGAGNATPASHHATSASSATPPSGGATGANGEGRRA